MAASLLLLAFAFTVPAPLANQVHVVDKSGGPGSQFLQISQAVAAAAPGDTVLVRTGGYDEFTVQGKSLVVTADLGAFVEVPRFTVRDVPAGQSVRVHGIGTNSLNDGPALRVQDCLGPVWIEDCSLIGPLQALAAATEGVRILNSAAVSLHRCTLGGSFAYDLPAGPGLRANDSLVALFDCVAAGGQGGNSSDTGATLPAGPGALVDGGTLYASGSSFSGGMGGSGSTSFGCVDAGDGAPGLVLDGGAKAHLLDTATVGGAGGNALPGCTDGAPGPAQLILAGTLLSQAFPARSIEAPNPVRPGDTLDLTIDGVPGDTLLLWVSLAQSPVYVGPKPGAPTPVLGGVFLPHIPTGFMLALGSLPPGGLALQVTAPDPGFDALDVLLQVMFVSSPAAGGIGVSSGQGITLLGPGL
ncbi:MAG: right-handed parallel beta-helix repeat-containing protein [Planctomycetota bacterium]|jgi:hypothetical protein